MQTAHARIILHPALTMQEKRAAMDAARTFHRFGVESDCIDDFGKAGMRALREVKRGEKLHGMVMGGDALVRVMDLRSESLWVLFFDKRIFGLGITPFKLYEVLDGQPCTVEPRIGLSLPNAAGIVSLHAIRGELDGDEAADAATAAVRHELGHVFGRTGHCTNASCIMQANENFLDFVERFVKPKLDFCRECEGTLHRHLAETAAQYRS